MEFAQALPFLVSSYRRGELVPFIGAGMSRKVCSTWDQLILALEGKSSESPDVAQLQTAIAQLPVQPTEKDFWELLGQLKKQLPEPTPTELIRRADRAVKQLQVAGPNEFLNACKEGVKDSQHAGETPGQTEALASISWSLVISTNYDDWYAALHTRIRSKDIEPLDSRRKLIDILGRSPTDCQKVLESLTRSTKPILWAVQGFLGGQAGEPDLVQETKAKELAKQVVVGHYHYQRVINAEPQFRRAFAEVFRRRSFLFLGSGLKEDYFVNLFSEILLTFGAGSLPHYALFRREEAKDHVDFLLSRLNVTPILYENHEDLSRCLDDLRKGCSARALTTCHIVNETNPLPIGGGSKLEEHRLLWGDANHQVKLVLRWGELHPQGNKDECLAFSAGRRRDGSLKIGGMGWAFFKAYHPDWDRQKIENPGRRYKNYIYQYGTDPLYAVAARDEDRDERDLRKIAPAIKELLELAAEQNSRTVQTGLIAAGPERKWHPTFSLIEMLRGARDAATELKGNCPSLVINIVEPAVWFPLLAQELGVDDILAGLNVKFWAESQPNEGEQLRLLCVRSESENVSDVARLFGFKQGSDSWVVEVHPRPWEGESSSTLNAVWELNLKQIGIVHGSTLLFSEKKQQTTDQENGITATTTTFFSQGSLPNMNVDDFLNQQEHEQLFLIDRGSDKSNQLVKLTRCDSSGVPITGSEFEIPKAAIRSVDRTGRRWNDKKKDWDIVAITFNDGTKR